MHKDTKKQSGRWLNGYLPCLPKLTCHSNIFHGFVGNMTWRMHGKNSCNSPGTGRIYTAMP